MCVRLVLRFLSCWFGIWLILRTLVAQRLKRLPGMWKTRVRSLGREDLLEKEMAPHSNTLAWRIPWREEPGRLQSMGSQSRTRLRDFTFTFTLGLTTSPGLPSQLSWKRIHLQCRRPQFSSRVEKIHWRRDRLPTPVFLGFPFWLSWQRICLQCGRLGKGYPLQYSGLENSMDCILQSMGVTKSCIGVVSSITGLGRLPGGGHVNPLQYSFLENTMERSLVGYVCSTVLQRVGHD